MRLIITGGGTGGHLFPGIAVAMGMQARCPETRVLFVGTDRQVDRLALSDLGFERAIIRSTGLKGAGILGRLKAVLQLPLGLWQAMRIIRRFKPELVLGVGGYVTGPVLAAAKMLKVPVCIHEQNSIPGMANRLAGRFVDRIFISIPCSPNFPPSKTILSGNPVRAAILEAAVAGHRHQGDKQTLLVLGGSQGARSINLFMLAATKNLIDRGEQQIRIIHQTGNADTDFVRQTYAALGQEAEVDAFFPDMAALYSEADLVVSRAGATTLAELAVVGLPCLLIPYPHAADDHQMTNALHYASGGGARVLDENDLSADLLADTLASLLHNPTELHTMAANMKKMGLPQATERILDACQQLVNGTVDEPTL